MEKDEQLKRIQKYSEILNKGEKLIEKLEKAIYEFKAFESEFDDLDIYYQSQDRKDDLKLDENHEVPESVNRSVLGEDYCYDFLCDYDEFKKIIR